MSESISALFPQAQRQVFTLQQQLSSYESGASLSHSAELAIQHGLDSLARSCGEMELAANKEGARREMWKQRIRGLQDEVHMMRASFTRAQQSNPHSAMNQAAASQAVRDELFAGRSSSSSSTTTNPSAIDSFVRQHDSLERSHRMMDDLQEMGARALDSLRSQRTTLKGAHRKAMDVANVLGMSGALMKVIGREDQMNAWVTYGCMILTVIVVLLLWWCVR